MKKVIALTIALVTLASISTGAFAGMGINVDVGGMPSLRMALSKEQSVDVGITYSQTAANSSTITALGRFNNKLADISKTAMSYMGGSLTLTSATAAGVGTTTIALSGFVGGKLELSKNVEIYSNINVIGLTQTATAGTSTTLIGVLTGPVIAYTGITVYL